MIQITQKNHQTDSTLGPKRIPKSIKNLWKSRSGPQGVLLGVPGYPRIIKMVTQGTKIHPKDVKMEPPGLPNHWYASPASHQLTGYQDAPGYQKKNLQVCHLASLGTQNHPLQHSASPASPANAARPARNKQQATSNQQPASKYLLSEGGRRQGRSLQIFAPTLQGSRA